MACINLFRICQIRPRYFILLLTGLVTAVPGQAYAQSRVLEEVVQAEGMDRERVRALAVGERWIIP